ncbi:MAG: flagellar protein FliS [Gammaproteobacteria bacterium]|nr:flagellar protein FliS [Gammaproteobacteria bacterium]
MNTNVAANAYRSVKRASIAEGSTPHSLISQLYIGAIDSIAVLINADTQNTQLRTHHINKSVAIINELQASLHRPDEDEIAGNLFSLYAYIVDQLQLERKNDNNADLQACLSILNSLQGAWSEITIAESSQ